MIRILGVGNSLITGLQGAGKSHFIMSQIVEILENEPNLTIYLANVDGVTLQSPRLQIVSPDFSWHKDAVQNSLIVYDEAGTIQRFNNSSTRINSSDDVQNLTMARHQGKTIVFMAQDSSIVHPAIRKLLTRHFHFSNPYNDKDKTHCFVFPQVQDRLDGQNKYWQNNAVEEFKHQLDPEIFPLYKSVDDGAKHTKKKQVNAKARKAMIVAGISAMLIIPAIVTAIYFGLSYVKDVWGSKEPNTTTIEQPKLEPSATLTNATQAINPAKSQDGYINDQNEQYARTRRIYEQRLPPDYDIITTDNNLRPAVAISMGGKCKVYNSHGDLMNYTYAECQDFLSEVGKLPNARTAHKFVSSHDGGQSQSQEPALQEVNPNAVSTL